MPHPSQPLPARGPWGPAGRERIGAMGALALVLALLGAPPVMAADPLGPGSGGAKAGAGASVAAPGGADRPARTRPRKALEGDPLQLHLASIAPDTLSDDDRPLTVTGTITNASSEAWTGINLYAVRSVAPITDATSLAASAATEPDAYVGDRIVEAGAEDRIEELAPGESAQFSLTVPRDLLTISTPGVYWLGVHAIGESATVPRDDFADGRARTFIPMVEGARQRPAESIEPVEAAVVLPVRQTVLLAPDGSIARAGRWKRLVKDGGRLDVLLDAGEAAGDTPITWLVDPAVPVAVARLAAGNPSRSLAPDPEVLPPGEQPNELPETPLTPAEETPEGPEPLTLDHDPVPLVDPTAKMSDWRQGLAAEAQAWLDRFTALVAEQRVLALPYGDLDVSAAAQHGPAFYEQAVARSEEVMSWLGVAASPALAPRNGVLSPAALQAATPASTLLVADSSFAVPPDTASSMVRLLGHKVVVTSSGAAMGGPGPGAPDDALALRQRLLSEAALRRESGSTAPVVMVLPDDWHPTDPGALLAGLEKRWLSPVLVSDVAQRSATALSGGALAYTEEDQALELPVTAFDAAGLLAERAALLGSVLTLPDLVPEQVADEVLLSLSTGHRVDPERTIGDIRAAAAHIGGQLASITVDAPDAVTLSSENGSLGADIVNGLDQPVTVRVQASSDGDLVMEDLGVRQLDAGARMRILPRIRATRPGIHQVRLFVTDAEDVALGASTSLQIRAARVSGLIWLLLAGGALLLFGTIAVRLVRRLRGRTAPSGETKVEEAP